jgi:hypothetical protein
LKKHQGKGFDVVIMNLKIMSWNVKGLNDKDKRLRMRNLFKLWKADVIYLRMRTQSMFLMCHGQEAC